MVVRHGEPEGNHAGCDDEPEPAAGERGPGHASRVVDPGADRDRRALPGERRERGGGGLSPSGTGGTPAARRLREPSGPDGGRAEAGGPHRGAPLPARGGLLAGARAAGPRPAGGGGAAGRGGGAGPERAGHRDPGPGRCADGEGQRGHADAPGAGDGAAVHARGRDDPDRGPRLPADPPDAAVDRPAAERAGRRGGHARQRRPGRAVGRTHELGVRRAGRRVHLDGGAAADDRGRDGGDGGADQRVGIGPLEHLGAGRGVQRRGVLCDGRHHDRGGGAGDGAARGARRGGRDAAPRGRDRRELGPGAGAG